MLRDKEKYHSSVVVEIRKTTYRKKGSQVEAKEDIGAVEEVADAHGGWWTRRKWICSAILMRYTKGDKVRKN